MNVEASTSCNYSTKMLRCQQFCADRFLRICFSGKRKLPENQFSGSLYVIFCKIMFLNYLLSLQSGLTEQRLKQQSLFHRRDCGGDGFLGSFFSVFIYWCFVFFTMGKTACTADTTTDTSHTFNEVCVKDILALFKQCNLA